MPSNHSNGTVTCFGVIIRDVGDQSAKLSTLKILKPTRTLLSSFSIFNGLTFLGYKLKELKIVLSSQNISFFLATLRHTSVTLDGNARVVFT